MSNNIKNIPHTYLWNTKCIYKSVPRAIEYQVIGRVKGYMYRIFQRKKSKKKIIHRNEYLQYNKMQQCRFVAWSVNFETFLTIYKGHRVIINMHTILFTVAHPDFLLKKGAHNFSKRGPGTKFSEKSLGIFNIFPRKGDRTTIPPFPDPPLI